MQAQDIYYRMYQDDMEYLRQLVQNNAHVVNPNSLVNRYSFERSTIAHTLCDNPNPYDYAFASFWFNTDFAIPINLNTKDDKGYTCFDYLSKQSANLEMLKIIHESRARRMQCATRVFCLTLLISQNFFSNNNK